MAYLKYYLYKKQISRDDGQTWSDVDPTELSPSGSPIGSYETLGECEAVTPEPPTPENDYFTIIAKTNGYIGIECTNNSATLSCSVNEGTWSSYSNNFETTVSLGDKIRVKSTSKPSYSGDMYFKILSSSSQNNAYYELYGNIMSLGYGDNFTGITSMSEMFDAYSKICLNNRNVINAENLVLPATTLVPECYYSMFSDCASLTKAPVLPATTLTDNCYQYMFMNCTRLNSITCYATDISANRCTTFWVYGVAANGTFTKASSMSSWTTGNDGIPSGWTIQNA